MSVQSDEQTHTPELSSALPQHENCDLADDTRTCIIPYDRQSRGRRLFYISDHAILAIFRTRENGKRGSIDTACQC